MDLRHSFTVAAPIGETWKTFEDIESVAGCFPGATVTEVDGSDFKGTCKVKLGPIALVYSGTGTFVEKDQSAHRFVVDAKGKDKRGNGTAGALVTATFAEEASGTRVDVHTDLSITGKPAQFGRGVIEDISNKLLQQFVGCLQDRVGGAGSADGVASAGSAGDDAGEPAEAAADQGPPEPRGTAPVPQPVAPQPVAPEPVAPRPAATSRPEDDALDLGATVLPVLARTYGPHAAVALLAFVVGYLMGRRRG